jgi:hypothetical protein
MTTAWNDRDDGAVTWGARSNTDQIVNLTITGTMTAVDYYGDGSHLTGISVQGQYHDGDTLQIDGITSDGGVFDFTTSDYVAFTTQGTTKSLTISTINNVPTISTTPDSMMSIYPKGILEFDTDSYIDIKSASVINIKPNDTAFDYIAISVESSTPVLKSAGGSTIRIDADDPDLTRLMVYSRTSYLSAAVSHTNSYSYLLSNQPIRLYPSGITSQYMAITQTARAVKIDASSGEFDFDQNSLSNLKDINIKKGGSIYFRAN